MAAPTISVKNSAGTNETIVRLAPAGAAKADAPTVGLSVEDAALLDGLETLLTAVRDRLPSSFATVAVKGASTAPLATDPALVVALSPNSLNSNGSNTRANSAPTVLAYEEYETVAASQTDQIMGATGAVGDVLAYLLVIPATTSPGAVSIKDGNGSAIPVFDGGTLGSLIPFAIPLNIRAANSTTPGWKISTGANVRVIAFGDFT